MFLSDTAIKRPVTVILFTAGTFIFGFLAFQNMGVDLYPEIEFPTVSVSSILPGADPEIMDSDVTDVLEEQINTIEGVKTIQSTSREGQSQIMVEFVLGKDVDVAAQEVRDKVNLAQRQLPQDLEPPIVQKLDMSMAPFLWIAVTSRGDYRRIARYAEDVVKERLQTVPGVGAVTLGGYQDRQIRIWLDPEKLEARNLTPRDVAAAVRLKHIELPGGRIEQPDREFVVKVKGEYESVEELRDLVVATRNQTIIRLSDVARVTDGSQDLRSIARFNGLPAVGLGIQKQSGTNTVEVAQGVKAALAEIVKTLPEDINADVAFDTSRFIEVAMNDVLFDLFLGAMLTAVVMLVFLQNLRMTFISVLAIPTSIIASFAGMYALDFTINNMTMLAMSLAIGVVIDDAIVVLENIYRHIEQGVAGPAAARIGTSEVALAVLAASSSIIAVFVPVAFMKGLIGRFFFQFGLAVALSVLLSVVISFTLTPMLCSKLLRKAPQRGRIAQALDGMFKTVEKTYAKYLDLALRRRWTTVGTACLVFVLGLALIPFVPKGLFMEPDESSFMMLFELPTGTSVSSMDQYLRKIETVVFEQEEVESAFSGTGMMGGTNSGLLFVSLLRPHQREATQAEVKSRLRGLVAEAVPEARVAIENMSPMGHGGRNADVQFIVKGPDVAELDRVMTQMMEQMEQTPGLVDIDNDLRLDKPELKVSIARNLADHLDVDVRGITENFNILFGGQDVATFKEGGKRYDIRLRAMPDARLTPDDLLEISMRSSKGPLIDAANLIEVEQGMGPDSIRRHNRMRSAILFANLGGIPLGTALERMNEIADEVIPDTPAWSTAMAGASDFFTESFQYLIYAVALALLMIYLILGSQFESFIHPFTIMTSVPLAIAGSLGLLLITGSQLDIFSIIGLVMLIGIVTKNAILLVDVTNQMRRQGMDRDEALRRAGPLRLRPILMTAFTTMAAVVPVAMALSEGGEQRAPMAVAVIGGMFTSTFLTLLVVPCVYTLMDDFGSWFVGIFRGFHLAETSGDIDS
ncbi:MAG: efflux RND transporter permease subunit [Acidobacteriota bacterium]